MDYVGNPKVESDISDNFSVDDSVDIFYSDFCAFQKQIRWIDTLIIHITTSIIIPTTTVQYYFVFSYFKEEILLCKWESSSKRKDCKQGMYTLT